MLYSETESKLSDIALFFHNPITVYLPGAKVKLIPAPYLPYLSYLSYELPPWETNRHKFIMISQSKSAEILLTIHDFNT